MSIFLVLSDVVCYLPSRYSYWMHVISRKMLGQFWEQRSDSERALARWFTIMQRHDFTSFETLRATFPTADKVEDFIFLMDEYGLTQSDLPAIGSQGVVSEVLRGKRELNIRQIRALATRFQALPAVFI